MTRTLLLKRCRASCFSNASCVFGCSVRAVVDFPGRAPRPNPNRAATDARLIHSGVDCSWTRTVSAPSMGDAALTASRLARSRTCREHRILETSLECNSPAWRFRGQDGLSIDSSHVQTILGFG